MTHQLNLILFIALFFFAEIVSSETRKGRFCAGHPVLGHVDQATFKSVIIRSWEFGRKDHHFYMHSFYQPRDNRHKYIPVTDLEVARGHKTACDFDKDENPNARRYVNLDAFVTHLDHSNRSEFVTLHFQRPAKVYLFVTGHPRDFRQLKKATLDGWKSEGWAMEMTGNYAKPVPFGVQQENQQVRFKKHLGKQVYVFSKEGEKLESIVLPSRKWLNHHIKGIEAIWPWHHVRVAEGSGKPVKLPDVPKGWSKIQAGERCPDKLHDLWRTLGDQNDKHVVENFPNGIRTWHPLFDPCYFCAYGHEHGSDAQTLMGYEPKFGYTALKNSHEDESHEGFKGHVLNIGDGRFMYFQVHAKVSEMRRYTARHHTMVIAITERTETNEFKPLMETSLKADFGFAAGKSRRGHGIHGSLGLTKEDVKMQNSKMRPFRQLNVLDPEKPAGSGPFRSNGMVGTNEHWFTDKNVLCMHGTQQRAAKLEIRNPSTATKDRDGTERVWLGHVNKKTKKMTSKRTSNLRDVTMFDVRIGRKYCGPWYIDDIQGFVKGDIFYTNPKATKIIQGPAKKALRQFVRDNFDLSLEGNWQACDTWVGLHSKKCKGFMYNIGNAIDPEVN